VTETPNLRESLLRRYRDLQGAQSSGSLYTDPSLAWPHYDANYWHWLEPMPKSATVVELGSGSGSLLGWLRSKGFEDLRGVDLSPDDVRFANDYLGGEYVLESDGAAYLGAQAGNVDIIVAKAIVEHVAKADLIGLVDAMAGALRPNGMMLIEVPNMDWVFSGHERYMDLTHEVGFTRESLATLLLLRFGDVEVRGSRLGAPTRSQRLFRRPLVAVMRRALYVVGEGASDVLFAHRSLVARASMSKSES
jgi:2-polyprenyl-3-methyl-5-hydroxy-6-metoxy-1,4-benzoquinol methylase